jgi:hypothetical protein
MADIFGRQDQILRGGLSSDSMFVTWPALAGVGGGLGMLIQRVGVDYSQPIRRIFEIGPGVIPVFDPASGVLIGSTNAAVCDGPTPPADCANRTQPTYYIIGRPEGRMQMGRIVGPEVLAVAFYTVYGSPCGPNVMSLSGKAGCKATDTSAKRMTWTMNGVTLDRINADITAQEMVIQEGISAMFAGLNLDVARDVLLVGG